MPVRKLLYVVLVVTISTALSMAQVLGQGRFGGATTVNPTAGPNDANTVLTIAGQVRGMDNHPVKDARIEVHDLSTGATIASAYTRPDGSFEINQVPSGTYEVVATHGLAEARQQLQLGFAEANVDLRLHEPPQSTEGSAQTVSLAELQVPNKARNELRNAQKNFDKSKFDEARQHVAKALDIYPRYANALALRGILNLHDQQADAARADLENAITYDPNLGMAYLALGSTYNTLNRFDDALRTLEHGASLNSATWQAQFETARAYLGKGHFAEALAYVTRAERLLSKDYPPLHLVKADACLGLKDYAGAIAQFEQYLSSDPNGPNALQARQALNQVKAFANVGK